MKELSHILLFFGSFNPIHKGHLSLAKEALEHFNFDELWFVLSPQSPFKNNRELLSEKDRAQMILLSIKNNPKIKLSRIESKLSTPSYTIHTLEKLHSLYPNTKFDILMGTDNLDCFYNWKDAEKILSICNLYVYPRVNTSQIHRYKNSKMPPHTKLEAKLLPISSSEIRAKWHKGEDLSPFMVKSAAFYLAQMK